MKKKAFIRCLLGAPIGLAISTIITVVISITVGDGKFYPVVPELVSDCGTELNAVVVQCICSLIYGAAWAGASLIWEEDNWSLLRQTITHLIVCSVATFPIAYLMRWMSHSTLGIAVYFGIFIGIYAIIWISQYTSIKKRLDQINKGISSTEGNGQ